LKEAEKKVEDYRKRHNIADISLQSREIIEKSSEYEKQIASTEIQLALLGFVENSLKKTDNEELLPANLGIQDAAITNMIGSYNELVYKYQQASNSATAENPIIIKLLAQIKTTKENILQSIDNFKKSAEITKTDLQRKSRDYYSKINEVPTIQREFTDISRQQQIKETLFVFLLQKREEAQLSLAMATSAAKIVEQAYTQSNPTNMGFRKIAAFAFLLGLVLALATVYVLQFFKDKISSVEELKRYTKLPLIGTLPHDKNVSYVAISIDKKRTVLGEKFRMIRTNLPFVMQNNGKVVIVTSSVPGEGKSFVSINLAISLSLINKKVALAGLDIRKPCLGKYLGLKLVPGITNFIADEAMTLAHIEQKMSEYKNLSIFVGGTVPPNPAELLYNSRLDMFFEELREKFDYVIVDTAPTSILTDTFIVSRLSDAVVYVVKTDVARYTDIKLLNELVDEKKLQNVSVLLNSAEESSKYGYKYGYY
jgi:capsular exopolysaccharide synthesis family protein